MAGLSRDVANALKRNRTEMERDEFTNALVDPTPDNQFGIPGAVPYRVIVTKNNLLADIVKEPDIDEVRKYVQIMLSYHMGRTTAALYVTYDDNEKVYEITTTYTGEQELSSQLFNDLNRQNMWKLKKRAWVTSSTDSTGAPLTNVSIRVASYLCKVLRILRSTLIIVEGEEEIEFIQNDKAFERDPKRLRVDSSEKK